MYVLKLDVLEPAENDPEHVIVGLVSQAESIFAKVEGARVCEVFVHDIFPAQGQ